MHSWKEAAEYYIGLKGRGLMILEEEQTGISAVVDLLPNSTVYVPGRTAHRTVNTGDVPLVYIGVYPSGAGHDYTTIAERNFSTIVVAHNGTPRVMSRADASRK
jgi:glucose-6-phosphate isomerase